MAGAETVASPEGGEQRIQYANKLELMLTLVGYAVGLGNIWRFPYLAFSYGGGAFLLPYVCALLALGLPLFILELGLGQMFRQGTLGVWKKLGLPRFQGVGVAATVTTFLVSLYYNVILGWTIYYLGRIFGSMFSGALPWDDQISGYSCPYSVLYPRASIAHSATIIDKATGLFNKSHIADFWCPATGIPTAASEAPAEYVSIRVKPSRCPAFAAVQFWEQEALQQSSGLDDLGGIHGGMLLSYTIAWLLIYLCICKGIASSGKVVYVTATLPYIALVVFFVRAITLPNAAKGVEFFVKPDFGMLLNGEVWLRAVLQIFYSLGVGFGSLIAFASYGSKHSDFARDAATVSFINCGTSIFAGFVVFPILGFLAHELSDTNPCIHSDQLSDLSSVGLSGTGLAFVAFPIAISQMPGSFFWSILFFITLLCLGIDSQFAMCESVITVLHDAGVERFLEKVTGFSFRKPVFVGALCFVSYLLGLVFVTRGGIYWFNLFDYYTCVVSLFFVTLLECIGLMWYNFQTWPKFVGRVQDWTGRVLGKAFMISWRFVVPALLLLLFVISFLEWDLMGARGSKPYPEGTGYLPGWSILVGWTLGLLPIVGFFVVALLPPSAQGGLERTGSTDSVQGNGVDPAGAEAGESAFPMPEKPAPGWALKVQESAAAEGADKVTVSPADVKVTLPPHKQAMFEDAGPGAAPSPAAHKLLQWPVSCSKCLAFF